MVLTSQDKGLLIGMFVLPKLYTPFKVITSMSTATVSLGNINLKSPLQMCWETVISLAISEIQISDSSKCGGGNKYSTLSSAYQDIPCLSMTCNSNEPFLLKDLSLYLSLSGTLTNMGIWIIAPFKVTKTSPLSILITSHKYFLSKVIWSETCP